jgi:basic amino acid/polyamine antiporter, APA family
LKRLFLKKKLAELTTEAFEEKKGLKRSLGSVNLVFLGIGVIIGAGIFVLTGHAAAQIAGPAITLSFVIAGIACVFAGLCYAELASMIPVAGSAYTYAYATLGQFVAWIVGWDLVLEYTLGATTVAIGWSGYFVSFIKDLGMIIPQTFTSPPINYSIENG